MDSEELAEAGTGVSSREAPGAPDPPRQSLIREAGGLGPPYPLGPGRGPIPSVGEAGVVGPTFAVLATSTRRHDAGGGRDQGPAPDAAGAGLDRPTVVFRGGRAAAGPHVDLADHPRAMIEIAALTAGLQVRLNGVDHEHAAALRDSPDTLQPIVVHAPTMTVVDGEHRLHVAQSRGLTRIEAILVYGDVADAFVLGVLLNSRHGLPLTGQDRRRAAHRILRSHPDWSDRRIAAVIGVSPKTVGAVRAGSTDEIPQSNRRIGGDGRVRPLDATASRRRALEMLESCPDATVRQIAQATGIAPSTVQDVRRRAHQGRDRPPAPWTPPEPPAGPPDPSPGPEEALPQGSGPATAPGPERHPEPGTSPQAGGEAGREQTLGPAGTTSDDVAPWPGQDSERHVVLSRLRHDPSLRGSENGRKLLRLLTTHELGVAGFESLASAVPSHQSASVAQLARSFADEWLRLAHKIDDADITPS